MDDEETVMDIPAEDALTHEHATHLGATLQAGHKMYNQLQSLYIPNTPPIVSDRPMSKVPTDSPPTSRADRDYQSIEDEVPEYHNIHRGKDTEGEKESQRYENVRSKVEVHEAVYDEVEYNGNMESNETHNDENYYNVTAVDRNKIKLTGDVEQTMCKSQTLPITHTKRKEALPPLAQKPSLAPKPSLDNLKTALRKTSSVATCTTQNGVGSTANKTIRKESSPTAPDPAPHSLKHTSDSIELIEGDYFTINDDHVVV